MLDCEFYRAASQNLDSNIPIFHAQTVVYRLLGGVHFPAHFLTSNLSWTFLDFARSNTHPFSSIGPSQIGRRSILTIDKTSDERRGVFFYSSIALYLLAVISRSLVLDGFSRVFSDLLGGEDRVCGDRE